MGKARWLVLVAMGIAFWVAIVMMPPELAQIDEKHVLWQASSYGVLEIARNLMRDSHPPVYYWIIHLWWKIGGFDRPYGYRVLSILLGLPALPLAFQIGRRVAGVRGGLGAVAFMMINPFYIFQLFLIRMYGLVIALGAALAWLMLRMRRRPSWGLWVGWAILQGVLLFTHYYSALLIGAQIVVLGLRRPRGWRVGFLISMILWGAWGIWLLQAYSGTMENTVRNLSAIPVRPAPWEVVEHFWANLLVGPLADGSFARAVGMGAALAVVVGLVLRRRGWRSREWREIGLIAWLPLGIGALIALRWPFFGARYFAMVLVPFLIWIIAPLMARSGLFLVALLVPGLIGLSTVPMVQSFPDAGDTREIGALAVMGNEDPILIQAWWHSLWPEYPAFRSYDWSDPRQRSRIISQYPSFWFIGVSLYRGNWEDWLAELRSTHLVDFSMEIDHFVLERRASIFHLVRKIPPTRWVPAGAQWENGLRLDSVGWIDEKVVPGRSFQIALRLSTDRLIERRWTLFLHLVDEGGRLWANWDAEPDPIVSEWIPGQEIVVGRSLMIPLYVPPGRYRLQIGWYETGTPGFPRLPLQQGGDSWVLGEVEVLPRIMASRIGAVVTDFVEMDPPVVRMVQGVDGWRLEVQMRWQSRGRAHTSGWQVRLSTPGGLVPLERVHPVPDAVVSGGGWLTEVWVSPPLHGTRPALNQLEILYEGQRIADRPVWLFPSEAGWVYGWLFLNRFPR
mgnify:CR=1 FL=1